MQQVMRALEEQLERDQRSLRSVDSDVARILTLLALSAPPGAFLELGSSGGYSSLWLSLATRAKGVKLTTVDLDEKKVALARTNIAQAGADGSVQVFHGDAFDYAGRSEPLAFCFSSTNGCVTPISSGTFSCSPAPAAISSRCYNLTARLHADRRVEQCDLQVRQLAGLVFASFPEVRLRHSMQRSIEERQPVADFGHARVVEDRFDRLVRVRALDEEHDL
jgi:SAM-dependent methyltransferase